MNAEFTWLNVEMPASALGEHADGWYGGCGVWHIPSPTLTGLHWLLLMVVLSEMSIMICNSKAARVGGQPDSLDA